MHYGSMKIEQNAYKIVFDIFSCHLLGDIQPHWPGDFSNFWGNCKSLDSLVMVSYLNLNNIYEDPIHEYNLEVGIKY